MRSGKRFEGSLFCVFLYNFVYNIMYVFLCQMYNQQSRAQPYVQFILYMYIFHFTICLIFVHVPFWIDSFVHVQNNMYTKYVHFFMIYVQAEGVPLNRPRDAITLGEVFKMQPNSRKKRNSVAPGSHWLSHFHGTIRVNSDTR